MHANVFIDYLISEKRFSNHTIRAYKSDLAQFTNFVFSTYGLQNIDEADYQMVRSWVAKMVQDGINARTANRKISTLKSYCRFLMIREIITTNPMHKIIAPKISKKLPVFIETSKMDKLFKMMGEGDDFKSLRRRMVMEILYATGIRVSELIELRHKHIDTTSKIIRVSGKRKKQRIIPIAPYLCSIIDNYAKFKLQQGWNPAPGEFLITTTHGAKAYPKLIYNLVSQSLNLVTTQSKKSPHVIRHTFATGMLNNGADLNSIKELLGHTNLAATQVYTHNTIDRIKNIYQQAHPKA